MLVLADLIDEEESPAVPEPPVEDEGNANTQDDSTTVEIGTAVDAEAIDGDGATAPADEGALEEIPGDEWPPIPGDEWPPVPGGEWPPEEWPSEVWPTETLHRVIHDVTVRFENPIRNKHSGFVEHSMLSAPTGAFFGSDAVQAEEVEDEEAPDSWLWPSSHVADIWDWGEKDDETAALASGNDGILSWAQS
jgi:hypothetical protein